MKPIKTSAQPIKEITQINTTIPDLSRFEYDQNRKKSQSELIEVLSGLNVEINQIKEAIAFHHDNLQRLTEMEKQMVQRRELFITDFRETLGQKL